MPALRVHACECVYAGWERRLSLAAAWTQGMGPWQPHLHRAGFTCSSPQHLALASRAGEETREVRVLLVLVGVVSRMLGFDQLLCCRRTEQGVPSWLRRIAQLDV